MAELCGCNPACDLLLCLWCKAVRFLTLFFRGGEKECNTFGEAEGKGAHSRRCMLLHPSRHTPPSNPSCPP